MELPIGSVVAYAGPADDAWENANGWMVCNGRSLDRTNQNFQKLFNAIGTSWGGDGVNRFNLPDLRGRFLRGVDGNTGRDRGPRSACQPGGHTGINEVGSVEEDSFEAHAHSIHGSHLEAHGGKGFDGSGMDSNSNQSSGWTRNFATSVQGQGETRPMNANVNWLIRFR